MVAHHASPTILAQKNIPSFLPLSIFFSLFFLPFPFASSPTLQASFLFPFSSLFPSFLSPLLLYQLFRLREISLASFLPSPLPSFLHSFLPAFLSGPSCLTWFAFFSDQRCMFKQTYSVGVLGICKVLTCSFDLQFPMSISTDSKITME